jgi:hypothetical protein
VTDMATIRAGAPDNAPAEPQAQSAGSIAPLELARQAFTGSTTYFDSSVRKQVESAMRQFQGIHPVGSKYHSDSYKIRSRLFRPKTRAAIRKNEASAAQAFFATRDVVAVLAEDDSDPLQLASSGFMKALMEFRLRHSIPWFKVCMGAYQEAQTLGTVVSYEYWRYDNKRGVDMPCIELVPLENFRFDPGASWLDPVNTSPYNIRMIPMYVKDVRARIDGVSGKPKWNAVSDAQLLAARTPGGDTTRLLREHGRQDSKDQSTGITSFTIVWVHENIIDIDGEDQVFYTLGQIAMLSEPKPLKDVYWHGRRPFTMGHIALEAHKNYPGGLPELTKDTQAEVNHVANLRLDNWAYALNKRYFVKRGVQVDVRALTKNVPGSAVLMNDPKTDVEAVDTQDVTSNAFQEQDRLNLDFDDLSGAFSASSVQSNRKLNETVGGLNLISNTANEVGNYQLRTFVETWVQPCLEKVMLLESFYEDDQRVLAIAKGAATKAGFDIQEITDELMQQPLMLAVDVGQSATNPQDRINNFMLAMNSLKTLLADGTLERYGLDVQDVIEEIFGHLGYRDGRRFFDKADDPTLQGLRGQLEQLQQALAAKVNPDLLAAQIRKLDGDTDLAAAKQKDIMAAAIQKGVAAAFAALQAGEVIAAVPAVAPIADMIVAAASKGLENGAPQFPEPAGPQAGVAIDPKGIKDRRTATVIHPDAANSPDAVPAVGQPGGSAPGDTSPQTPAAPVTPGTGAERGIETMRPDSA